MFFESFELTDECSTWLKHKAKEVCEQLQIRVLNSLINLKLDEIHVSRFLLRFVQAILLFHDIIFAMLLDFRLLKFAVRRRSDEERKSQATGYANKLFCQYR